MLASLPVFASTAGICVPPLKEKVCCYTRIGPCVPFWCHEVASDAILCQEFVNSFGALERWHWWSHRNSDFMAWFTAEAAWKLGSLGARTGYIPRLPKGRWGTGSTKPHWTCINQDGAVDRAAGQLKASRSETQVEAATWIPIMLMDLESFTF